MSVVEPGQEGGREECPNPGGEQIQRQPFEGIRLGTSHSKRASLSSPCPSSFFDGQDLFMITPR